MIDPNGVPLPAPVPLLDHGYVRLVDFMGGDLSIVRAARVSYDAAWRAGENEGSDARLIRYLWAHRHTTPFEAVTLTFEVHAPIFVFRQWHRHRTWSFNELSARYRELPEEFYTPDPALVGMQAQDNKQGRMIADTLAAGRVSEVELLAKHSRDAFTVYRALLLSGWPRELARSVLPVNTYSTMFATVDLLNLLKFLTLRCDSHAQYEIRVYADAMRELARHVAPIALDAWAKEAERQRIMADTFPDLVAASRDAEATFEDYGDMHAAKLLEFQTPHDIEAITAKVDRNRRNAARHREIIDRIDGPKK